MSNWRDAILKDFVPNFSKLTLVADPDCLLTEEKLALELRGRGFDLIEFNDPVEFRYAYESKYRSLWDLPAPQSIAMRQAGRGEHTDLVVVLRLQDAELESLPYDLLQAGRMLSFNLGDLFPNLSYPVIEKLDRSLLDSLFEAQRKSPPDRMGDNATKDFILRHVFGIAAELIANEVELLRALLRLHYGKLQIPLMLAERLIQVLKGHDGFKAWPLSEIVPDDEAFFAFLQERWPLFLSAKCGVLQNQCEVRSMRCEVEEGKTHYAPSSSHFRYPGPEQLPFDHQDILVYLDNLFLEGKLRPVEVSEAHFALRTSHYAFGVTGTDDDELRISRLFDLIEKDLPTAEARYSDWTAFALKWAELSALVHCGNSTEHQTRLREIGDALNSTFAAWLKDHYASLINLPPTNPAMLHHVPRRLARDIEDSGSSRTALIVVDGLALDQWVTIRQLLQKRDANLVMRESATFAWIPTLTCVSRQSIFSGKPPLYFPSSINSTNSEEKLWKQFWEGHGLSRLDVAYQRGLGDLPAPRPRFFCYVLKCADGSFYIGQTDDIGRRLKEHERKECSWTSSRLPVEIVHHECLNSREEAVAREKELKTGYGRAWLKKLYAQGKLNADWGASRQAGGDAASVLDSAIHPGKTKVVGLVVDKVDKIMHGMQLGSAGMHNQIKQWCRGGFLAELVGQLLEYGYEVWLTADHGNIQCDGKGRPSEGVIAETRGERVRVYPTPELRAQVAGAFPFAQEWQPVGLPADYFPLVAGGHDAFVNPGNAIVGHGGVAIEEVIVPLVKFERRTR